jgi:hypothetical protein
MWRDLLRTFFNLPVHYLYGGSTASYAAYGQSDFVNVDPSEAWPENTKVVTIYGSGVVKGFRSEDSLYKVQLPFGMGYLVPSAILGAEDLSPQALHAIGVSETPTSDVTGSSPSTSPVKGKTGLGSVGTGADSGVKDPCRIFYGTHWCYVFFRLHHTIFSRLCAARDMSAALSQDEESGLRVSDPRSGSEYCKEDAVGEMDVVIDTYSGAPVSKTRKHRNHGTKPPYQAFLGQLYAVIEGAIDSSRYEVKYVVYACIHINMYIYE